MPRGEKKIHEKETREKVLGKETGLGLERHKIFEEKIIKIVSFYFSAFLL